MIQRVGYNKAFSIPLMLGSVFILGTTLLIGVSLNTITGVLLFIMSLLYLNNSAIEYDEKEVRVKNLYGMVMKRYNLTSDKIEIRDGAAFVNDKKLFPGIWVLNKAEYNTLVEYLSDKGSRS